MLSQISLPSELLGMVQAWDTSRNNPPCGVPLATQQLLMMGFSADLMKSKAADSVSADSVLATQASAPLVSASNGWLAFTSKPTRHSKPQAIQLMGKVKTVRTWRELFLHICTFLAENYPDRMLLAATDKQFQGLTHRYFGFTNEGMHQHAEIKVSGKTCYVTTDHNCQNIIVYATRMLTFCGVDVESIQYKLA